MTKWFEDYPVAKSFNVKKVAKAYSGKPGCMCGCKGRWYYRPSAKNSDYGICSDRSVDAVAKNMQAFAAVNGESMRFDASGKCVFVESSKKMYAVYFD